ncbi:hypothetical protein RHMOL_Rhmol08G0325900 [Rhododendron molle]|uniref:Uncharacterized protein n=1 Tax=Rhododendron molle TaxID=49168 RepID=A0ACC0MUX6_RHOML|nr:hypothetical protein RHMOL_Rhmol08G0325900 [Rhododendron molle]
MMTGTITQTLASWRQIEEPGLRGHGLGLVSSRAGISGLESFKIKPVKQQQCSIHKRSWFTGLLGDCTENLTCKIHLELI